MNQKAEFSDLIELWHRTVGIREGISDKPLEDLLEMIAEATRELCAEFPEHKCHNGGTNNWKIAEKVAAHLRKNYPILRGL